MSTLNVDKVDPSTGTALEIGSSGDTVTVPSGATLTLTSATLNLPTTITSTTEVKTNKISPATGAAFALGDSGDTFTVPSGATIVNSGTATGFGGGKVVQYAVTTNSAAGTNGTSTYATTGLEQAFTPTNASNIILVQCYTPYAAENDGVAAASGRVGYFAIYKDTTILADVQSIFGQDMAASSTAVLPRNYGTAVLYGTETAGSTDARTYKMMAKGSGVSVVSFNYSGNDSCMIVWELEV